MLSVSRLSKRYGARLVFRDVAFEVSRGSIAAITGNNGAGKSTLLRILAGVARPSSGNIQWQNSSARFIGLFAPDAPVYRELSVRENLEFFARVAPEPSTPLGAQIENQLERFALGARQNQLAGDLSSGWRARLQLAVATLGAPEVLLLDEPSAHLDAAGLELLRGVLQSQRERGLALVATNDEREVARCDFSIEL
jgi:heme exporter protein A